MKKMILSLSLGLSLITNVYAQNDPLQLINSEISNILAPFKNQNTTAQLQFNELDMDEKHVKQFAFKGVYEKTGSQNNFTLRIDKFSYHYGGSVAPTTAFKGLVGLDLTKILPKQELNLLIPKAIELVETLINADTESSGAITSTTKDEEGNYTAFSSLLSFKLNLDKLPENVSRDSVQFTYVVLALTLDVKKGIFLEAYFKVNPEYSAFKEDQIGLKETFEQIITHDEATVENLNLWMTAIDDFATSVVETNNSSYLSLLREFLGSIEKGKALLSGIVK